MNKLKAQIKAFWESPLDEEEQWYENHSDEFKPVDKQSEMRKEMIEAANKLSPSFAPHTAFGGPTNWA
ncbi:MAG: hypothetical protein II507_13155 [Treponema sp.]|nr:hypothetical protein [Treponema sp.]